MPSLAPFLGCLAGPVGFEPTSYGFGDRCFAYVKLNALLLARFEVDRLQPTHPFGDSNPTGTPTHLNSVRYVPACLQVLHVLDRTELVK
jgi:hypothetical protein